MAVCQVLCPSSEPGCSLEACGIVSLLNLSLRMTASKRSTPLPSVRKAAALLGERRLTSPTSRSITVVLRIVAPPALLGRRKRSGKLHDRLGDPRWLSERCSAISRVIGHHGLIGLLSAFLREYRFELCFDLYRLVLGNVAEHGFPCVHQQSVVSVRPPI